MIALVLKAALGSIPPDPATQAQALRVKQTLTAVAGEGTLNIALLNVESLRTRFSNRRGCKNNVNTSR